MAGDSELTTWAAESRGPALRFLRTTLGPALLVLVTPPVAILLWSVCAHLDGSLSRLLTAEGWEIVIARLPAPSLGALAVVLGFAAFQLALLRLLPGPTMLGPLTPRGVQPRYKLNGIPAWGVTHAAFFGASFGLGLFPAGVLYDIFGELLMTLVVCALAFCVFLYFKGRLRPSGPDHSLSGNVLFDWFWGVELHPTCFGVAMKQLVNCRLSMMGWSLLVCSFAAKQAELHGAVTSGMAVSAGLVVAYLFKFFWWEGGYFTSLDIMHDRFGYYIAWGVLAWVPAVYPISVLYQVTHPNDLSWPVAIAVFAFGLVALAVNYAADAQRQRVRASRGETRVWGRPPEIIRARYTTADGAEHESLLLASGFWGIARHFHYLPELALAFAWSVPAGFGHLVPYVYVIFLTILLVDRAHRDDRRCAKKYGVAWDEYRRRVPWRMLPGLY
jgi:7-dehydrocholesterol reductase